MKNNKGITLIALIITIIVMLILVAVTVTFALQGGLFERSKEAAEKTEPQAIYETIVSATQFDDNGYIKVKVTAEGAKKAIEQEKNKNGRPEKPTTIEPNPLADNAEEATLTVEGKYGTYKYKITGEKIELIKDDNSSSTTPWYILKKDEKTTVRNNNKSTIVTAEMAQQTGLPEGGEIFTIASDGQFNIQYVEMTSPAEFVFLNMNNIYVYMGADETNAAILGEYYTPNAWLYDMNTVYTGSCPMLLYNMMYHKDEYCFCEPYLKRVIEHFGTPNWYEINSQEEFNELARKNAIAIGNDGGDGAIIASDIEIGGNNFDSRQNDYIIWYDNAMIAVNINGIGKYIYVTNKEEFSEEMYHKWFRFPDNSDDMSELTESAAPTLTGNEFNIIYSQDYLNRLLEHI